MKPMVMSKNSIPRAKIRTLIKAYLVFNKGKKCSGKEIADFINTNKFGLAKHNVHPAEVYRMIVGGNQIGHILYDVKIEKIKNLNHYWVE